MFQSSHASSNTGDVHINVTNSVVVADAHGFQIDQFGSQLTKTDSDQSTEDRRQAPDHSTDGGANNEQSTGASAHATRDVVADPRIPSEPPNSKFPFNLRLLIDNRRAARCCHRRGDKGDFLYMEETKKIGAHTTLHKIPYSHLFIMQQVLPSDNDIIGNASRFYCLHVMTGKKYSAGNVPLLSEYNTILMASCLGATGVP